MLGGLLWSIWAYWIYIELYWDPFGKPSGPKWFLEQSVPSQQETLSKAIWTNLDFIQSCSTFFKMSILVYLDLWTLYKILLGPLREIIWANMKFRPSVPAQQKTLSKAIWANVDFIPSCSTFFKKSILAYLDLWAFYEILLGPL